MEALGLDKSAVARLAEISRTTVYQVFKGTASPAKVQAVREALDFAESNPDDVEDLPDRARRSPDGQLVEFEVSVDAIGLRVFVRGGVENADDLQRLASKVFREVQAETKQDPAGD